MHLLVTRPREDAERFAAALEAAGHTAVSAPLLRIVPTGETPDLTEVGALVFTSPNGLRAFAAASRRRDLPVFAVGARTAAEARAAGFAEVVSADGDIDDLTRLLARDWRPAAGPLLHLSGRRVAGDLAARLAGSGIAVRRTVLYEAQPVAELPEAARTALRDGTVEGVTFFSPRTAESFARLVQAAGLERSTERLTAFCLSAAVAKAAKALRWAHVRVAAQPTQAALLAALNHG